MPVRMALLIAGLALTGAPAHAQTLAERLGYSANDKLLIINADDAGMSRDSNAAVIDTMENGLVTSATIMVPPPGFAEIAAYASSHPEADFGVHLTHTSEWKNYRWGSTAPPDVVSGLLDADGWLWPEVLDVYEHGSSAEAEIEARAQIDAALAAGIDVTHIDSHMGTMQYKRSYAEAYARVAVDYDLPLRMGSQSLLVLLGQSDLRQQLRDAGVVMPDRLILGDPRDGETVKDYWLRVLRDLEPGVTEIFIHPALASEEMMHITNSWPDRAEEHRLFTSDPDVRRVIEEEGIKLIGYRELRDLQRGQRVGVQPVIIQLLLE